MGPATSAGPRWKRLRFLLAPERRDLEQRLCAVRDAGLGDFYFHDVLAARKIEHHFHEHFLEDRAKTACTGAALERLLCDCRESAFVESDFHFLETEELRVLLRERVLRLLENPYERLLVERLEGHRNRQTPYELRNHPVPQQVVRLDLGEHLGRVRTQLLLAG